MNGHVLIIDDDVDLGQLIVSGLEHSRLKATFVTDGVTALNTLASEEVDAIVTDLNMPGRSGLELCTQVNLKRPDIPVIVITAYGSLETAVSAIRCGAYDFVTKPFNLDVLVLAIERALRHRRGRDCWRSVHPVPAVVGHHEDILGHSPAMNEIHDLVSRLADSDVTVLLSGESGTGKDVVAKALHRRGPRRDGPFIAINCAAVPEHLLESELFGHVRGAYTDAKASRTGLLTEADGGTLFLDEIGDMPLALQPKLLRALEERVVRPLGATRDVAFDARIVVATNRNLEDLVEKGRFREDLYYRVNVMHLAIPPLRARGNDILDLAHCFLERYATRANKIVHKLDSRVAESLLAYNWPGNVRELRNVIERAVALTQHDSLVIEDLPSRICNQQKAKIFVQTTNASRLPTLEEVEQQYIEQVMQATSGNKTIAAEILGLDRRTLYRKLNVTKDDLEITERGGPSDAAS